MPGDVSRCRRHPKAAGITEKLQGHSKTAWVSKNHEGADGFPLQQTMEGTALSAVTFKIKAHEKMKGKQQMEIVVLGYAGESGSRRIFADMLLRERLLQRYPERFFRCFTELAETEQSETETAEAEAAKAGIAKVEIAKAGTAEENMRAAKFLRQCCVPEEDFCEAADGGVFAALWRLLKEKRHTGAVFSQRAVPLRQQTVELCEYFDIDPFRLQAEGCFVCLLEDGARFCRRAEAAGFAASVIGYTEAGCAVKRIDGEETAYLRRPEEDALLKLLREKGRRI